MEELQLRKGYIRCINCAHIFDGYDAVVSAENSVKPTPASTSTTHPQVASPQVDHLSAATAASPSVVRLRKNASVAAPEPVFHLGQVAVSGDVGPVFELGAKASVEHQPQEAVVHRRAQPDDEPVGPIYVEARHSGRRQDKQHPPRFSSTAHGRPNRLIAVFWQVAIALALALILGQLAYVYRVQIAGKVPALRPALESACSYLNCTVAYARRIDLIMISGAALSAKTPKDDGIDTMELLLTLRNTHDKPQEWPTLELDLNDFSGTLQVRKNITPKVYLTAAQLQQPFAANSEMALRIPLVLHGLAINGFQVRKFFP